MTETSESLENNIAKTEIQRPSMDINYLNLLTHRLGHNQDGRCKYIEWMGEDLNHCPGIGEWKCKLRGYRYASDQYGIDSYDYLECNCKDDSK
jgi:hypothetical protein